MNKISKLFMIGLFIISCNSPYQKNFLTKKEFTKKYFETLAVKFPNEKFNIIDDSTIKFETKENDISISVDNAYKEYQLDPDSLQKTLNKYVSATGEIMIPRGKINADRIVPIIKPKEFINDINIEAKKMGGKKDDENVYEKYNDQLIIVYAEDTENNIRYLIPEDIKSLSINPDSLRTIAIRNLDRLLINISRKGENGVFMILAGGNYEASIILLDNIFTKESIPVNGDFVVAIPCRDILLITGSNDSAGISKIKKLVNKNYKTGSYQVSQFLYKWNGKIFEKFQ